MKKIALLISLLICSFYFGQKLKVVSGDYSFLKDQKQISVELNMQDAKFQEENYSEDQYVQKILGTIKNNPKKTAQDAENWNSKWNEYRNGGNLDAFIKGANGKTKKFLEFGKDLPSKYKLLIDTKWIYAGWYGGMLLQPAKMTLTMKFVEAENPSNVLLQLETDKLEGAVSNKEQVWEYGRIAMAYEYFGKQLGIQIKTNR